MAGPQREWHIGDHGPGPTSWSERGPKPMAAQRNDVPCMVKADLRSEPRMGRDPHDHVTMELPLEVPRTAADVECELAHVLDALPTIRLLNAAKLAEDEGRDSLSWMYLMEREVRR